MKTKNFVLAVLLVLILSIYAVGDTASYSWYFKPRKDGLQPELIPEAMGFVNKYQTITIGSADEKSVYLTFDAGYENGNVEKILDILKEKDVKGAFFILPQLVKENTELVKRMKNEGHLVCNHTARHKDMSKITDFEAFKEDLLKAEEIFFEYTGMQMDKFYRPPEGRFSEKNLEFADSLGYTTVFWSLAYADWDNNNQMNDEKALNLVLERTHNGTVCLFHPTSKTNANILGRYIDTLKSEGYTFKSIYELAK